MSAMTVDAIERTGGIGGGKLPDNLWVIDPQTGDAYRTQDQPANASFFTEGVPDYAVSRSPAIWSPDGSQIAWTNLYYPEGNIELVVFDTAAQTARVIANDLPQQAGIPMPLNGWWGESGIILSNYGYDEATAQFTESLLVYTPDGAFVREIPLWRDGEPRVMETVLATYNGTEVMAVLFNLETTTEWRLVDLATGEMTPSPSAPHAVSALAPDTSLRIVPVTIEGQYGPTLRYAVHTANRAEIALPVEDGFSISRVQLSPDGQTVAYQQYNPDTRVTEAPITVWRDGQTEFVPETETADFIFEFTWAPLLWRVEDAAVS
jgi:hypothetical protein